jgi:DNA-binding NarL/FixJ family response regulator
MRALWIEDHQLIGESLEMLLHVVMPDISLDKARDWASGRRLIETFAYELVLLDWWLGAEDAEAALAYLRERGDGVPVIVVSGDDRPAVRQRALALGAVGYVEKSAEPSALVDAIRQAMASRFDHAPPGPATAAANAPRVARPVLQVDIDTAFPDLTPRQSEVFQLLMKGLADKQIARDLGISDTTVKTHVRAILQIVGVHSRGEAAYAARARGAGGG